MKTIRYVDRYSGKLENEQVYGGSALYWLYSKPKSFFLNLLVQPILSRLYGVYQDSAFSQWKIENFIKEYKINMKEYEGYDHIDRKHRYKSFNDFFIRKFKPGVRNFIKDEDKLGAMSEGRYLGFHSIDDVGEYPVKGQYLRLKDLCGKKWFESFSEGPLLISRLCPLDYHRFHFPTDSKIIDEYKIKGPLHSVNPWALEKKNDIFIKNDRSISILETKNFGKLLFCEVGALCVGKIVQSYSNELNKFYKKGEEKGYFLFGGSTVILIGEKGRWTPSSDILKNTGSKKETFVKLGDTIGYVD